MKEYAVASELNVLALTNLVNTAMLDGWEAVGGIVIVPEKDKDGVQMTTLCQALQREKRAEQRRLQIVELSPQPKKVVDEAGKEIGTALIPADGSKELEIGGKRYTILANGDGNVITVREILPEPPAANVVEPAPASNDAASATAEKPVDPATDAGAKPA